MDKRKTRRKNREKIGKQRRRKKIGIASIKEKKDHFGEYKTERKIVEKEK